MGKSIQEWIHEGEELHATAVRELAELEGQIAELDQKRSAKVAEVNQIAGIIGKPPAEGARRVTAHVVDDHGASGSSSSNSSSSATIARALAGKGLAR